MILGAMGDRMLQAAADDWIGVWELPWMASSVGGVSSPTEIRNLSLMVIRKALDEELLEVGDVTESGFRPWGYLRIRRAAGSKVNGDDSRMGLSWGHFLLVQLDGKRASAPRDA